MTTADLDMPHGLYRPARQDGGTRRMVLVAGALLGALVLAAAGAWMMAGRGPATIPLVEADPRPLRVKPENPGGLQVAGADDGILSGGFGDQPIRGLAPAPEAPLPLPGAAPAPRAQPVALAVPDVPAPASPAPEPPAAAAPAPPPRPAAAAGNAQVQLGALPSEDAARQEWTRLSRRLPELFRGRQPAITRLDRNGQTMFRLRTSGFADTDAARAFCTQVKAKGGACMPVT